MQFIYYAFEEPMLESSSGDGVYSFFLPLYYYDVLKIDPCCIQSFLIEGHGGK
jgi:hypothetical protein